MTRVGLLALACSCASPAATDAVLPSAPRHVASTRAPADAPTPRRLALGWRHSCAVSAAGETRCWGLNHQGQLGDGSYVTREIAVAVTGLKAHALALGETHSCAILADETLACWGDNGFGELGDGKRVGSTKPVRVAALDGIVATAAGEHHTCALRRDGSVWCWGLGDLGQLGANVADSQRPRKVPLDEPAVELAAGARFTCARTKAGRVLCWGANLNGQLGDGGTRSRATPAPVRGLEDAAALVAAGQSACALDAAGALLCWGAPAEGGEDRSAPTRIGTNQRFAEVALGAGVLCARERDSTAVVCAGQNVGVGEAFKPTLTRIPELDGATELAAGGGHACARRPDDSVVCFGWNEDGQVGDGSRVRRAPVVVPDLQARLIASYAEQTCAVTQDEALVCWGGSQVGADGTTQRVTRPTPVAAWKPTENARVGKLVLSEDTVCARAFGGAVHCLALPGSRALGRAFKAPEMISVPGGYGNADLAAGTDHVCLIEYDKPYCLGDGAMGALGRSYQSLETRPHVVNVASSATVIAAAGSRTCVIANKGETITCWGGGIVAGSLDGIPVSQPNAVQVAGVAPDRKAIALGFDVGCAVGKGPTQCFGLAGELSGRLGLSPATTGNNRPGAATVPGADDARDVATSGLHGCVVTEDGRVRCWGQNDVGQLGRPSEGVDLVAREIVDLPATKRVSVGARHSCALAFDGTVRCWGLAVHGQLGDGTSDSVARPSRVVWR